MTTQIEQIDREAAGAFIREYHFMFGGQWANRDWAYKDADKIINGAWDGHYILKAFARHRLAATPDIEALREGLARAYVQGAEDVHAEWLRAHDAGEAPPRGDPEFAEAGSDYASAALNPFDSSVQHSVRQALGREVGK